MHANEVETKENLKFPEIYTRSAWVQIALFADDSKLFRPIDCRLTWSTDHGKKFNNTKCKILNMTRKRSSRAPQHSQQLSGHNLASFTKSDLGVVVTDQLS